MIQQTPRSYVFNGLEIVRNALIPFIGKILRTKDKNTWWREYIYKKINEEHITKTGDIKDMYRQFDEAICFRVIKCNEQIFKRHINIDLVYKVHEIRTHCAHEFLADKPFDVPYADEALETMSRLIENIDKENTDRIIKLKKQMNYQSFGDKPVIASRESLIAFLKAEIWTPSFKLLEKACSLSETEKEEIIAGMNHAISSLEQNKTNEDVLNWFKYHIYSKEGIRKYKQLKSVEGVNLPTFEDVRLEFLELCYGEPL